jgi:hypothetical protein
MRGADLKRTLAGIVCAVQIVPAVPGFAQTNSRYPPAFAIERTSFGALRPYDARATDPNAGVPSNLVAPAFFQNLLASMVRRSPTFRRQCLRIAHAADLVVRLESRPVAAAGGEVRAETDITMKNGRVTAIVRLLRLDDPVELIAHEIEHVIEQLDGVDLQARAAVTDSGVRVRAGVQPMFETTRATRVGHAVAAEVRQAGW